MCITKNQVLAPICMALSILAIVATVSAHENHAHEDEPKSAASADEAVLKKINAEYISNVKPIFQKSCFDCHSSATRYPWYSKLPGAKQLIEQDIRESKKHLDLSSDFPFGGHGTPIEDLKAIQKAVKDGSMPPFRYRILHSGSGIGEEDGKKIESWIQSSITELESR